MMGVGYWLDPNGWGADSAVAAFLIQAGAAIIDKMAILFAVGVAYGMSKDKDGAAALAGLVAMLLAVHSFFPLMAEHSPCPPLLSAQPVRQSPVLAAMPERTALA